MNCLTSTTTICPCASGPSFCDCPTGVVDAGCVQYNGDALDNINVDPGDYLDAILQKLNAFIFAETPFVATPTDTIRATSGGTNGHSPIYDVRLDPSPLNAITSSSLGLLADTNQMGDGKVKVDASDDKDYLVNQMTAGSDVAGIITITPTDIGGVMYMVPTIDVGKLISYIAVNYKSLLCSLTSDCIPDSAATTSSTTTTTTTAGPTTTTTTTTTHAPNTFEIHNSSTVVGAFPIHFSDSVSSIDYVFDNTTGPGQNASYTYNSTGNDASITLQHTPTAAVGVSITVNGVLVYTTASVTSTTVIGISPYSDVIVTFQDLASTTTTTTTSTSSTTTTTTTSAGTTTTTTTQAFRVRLTSTLGGTTVTNVNGIPGFTPSPALPLNVGGDIRGNHSTFTGSIQIVVTGPPVISGNVTLFKNNGQIQFANLLHTDSYPKTITFSSFSFLSTDLISIALNSGTL